MPTDTFGWIEYSYELGKKQQDEYSWICWMNVNSTIQIVDKITGLLFGFSSYDAIAVDRGIPENASQIVKYEVETHKSFKNQYGESEFYGYTTIYYNEIKQLNISLIPDINIDSDWIKLFELIDHFMLIKNIVPEQIRLIVWFGI